MAKKKIDFSINLRTSSTEISLNKRVFSKLLRFFIKKGLEVRKKPDGTSCLGKKDPPQIFNDAGKILSKSERKVFLGEYQQLVIADVTITNMYFSHEIKGYYVTIFYNQFLRELFSNLDDRPKICDMNIDVFTPVAYNNLDIEPNDQSAALMFEP